MAQDDERDGAIRNMIWAIKIVYSFLQFLFFNLFFRRDRMEREMDSNGEKLKKMQKIFRNRSYSAS